MADEIRKETLFGFDGRALYAKEKPDVLPPIDKLKFINEKGEPVDAKIDTVADNAYYWRSKSKQIGLIIAFSGLGMLFILLGASDKYQKWIFDLIALPFGIVAQFFFGLLPKFW